MRRIILSILLTMATAAQGANWLTTYNELTTPAAGDALILQDVSDTSSQAYGTTKHILWSTFTTSFSAAFSDSSELAALISDESGSGAFVLATSPTITTPTISGNLVTDGLIDGVDIATDVAANTAKVTNATHTGDVTGATALTIGADKVLESHLKAVNAPTDEYVLTYEATTGDFEWQAAGSSFDATAQDALTWSDGANASNVWTFDISGAVDPQVEFSDNFIEFTGDLAADNLTGTNTGDQTATTTFVVTTSFGGNFANNTSHDTVQELMDIIDDLSLGGDVLADGSVPFTAPVTLFTDAAPTTNAAGEIALDSTITDHQPLFQYYDGAENMTIIAIDTAELPAADNEIIKYDAATDKFVLEADAGSGSVATDSIWTTAGDLVYGTGSSTASRLGIGTANQVLQVNSGATAPEWTSNPTFGTLTVTTLDAGALQFEGATADAFETTLDVVDPTADNTTTLPDHDLDFTNGFDPAGAIDIDYGSADITDHTFTTDGTGTAEIVLPAGAIDGTEILDDTVDSADYAAGSVDGEHLSADARGQFSEVITGGAAPTLSISASTGEGYGSVHYVDTADTVTLPAVQDGCSFTIITIGAVAVTVDVNASDGIMLDGSGTFDTDGDSITNSSTAGDMVVFTYYSATGWLATSDGNWTAN